MNMDFILVLLTFNFIRVCYAREGGFNYRVARWTQNTYRLENLFKAGKQDGRFSYVCRAHYDLETIPGYSFHPNGCCNIGLVGVQPVCDESVEYLVEDIEYNWVRLGNQENLVIGGMDDAGKQVYIPCLTYVNQQVLAGYAVHPASTCFVHTSDGVQFSRYFTVLQAAASCRFSNDIPYCMCR